MAIDFSNTEFEAEGLEEPLETTSLTREDEGEYPCGPRPCGSTSARRRPRAT